MYRKLIDMPLTKLEARISEAKEELASLSFIYSIFLKVQPREYFLSLGEEPYIPYIPANWFEKFLDKIFGPIFFPAPSPVSVSTGKTLSDRINETQQRLNRLQTEYARKDKGPDA